MLFRRIRFLAVLYLFLFTYSIWLFRYGHAIQELHSHIQHLEEQIEKTKAIEGTQLAKKKRSRIEKKSQAEANYKDEKSTEYEICGSNLFTDVSFVGGDHKVSSVPKGEGAAASCCKACVADPICVAWTLEHGDACWLKDSGELPQMANNECISGRIKGRLNNSKSCLNERSAHPLVLRGDSPTAYKGLGSKSILIAMTSHAIEAGEATTLYQNAMKLVEGFKDYRIIIHENEPSGGTMNVALNDSKLFVISERLNLPKPYNAAINCGRVRLLGMLRARLLHQIRDLHNCPVRQGLSPFQADYIILLDADIMGKGGIQNLVIGALNKRVEKYGDRYKCNTYLCTSFSCCLI